MFLINFVFTMSEEKTLIFDLGSWKTKVGFSGND